MNLFEFIVKSFFAKKNQHFLEASIFFWRKKIILNMSILLLFLFQTLVNIISTSLQNIPYDHNK